MLKSGDDRSTWLQEHAWIRTAKQNSAQPQTLNEEIAENKSKRSFGSQWYELVILFTLLIFSEEAAIRWKNDLMNMATLALLEKVENDKGYQDLEFLLRKQGWMDQLKNVRISSAAYSSMEFIDQAFFYTEKTKTQAQN